ncbi:hypothetical protein GCM10027299_49760 [Larkinella ripae]
MKKPAKPSESDQVAAFMAALDYPLKAEVETLRQRIKEASPELSERIKWNAPSYYTEADLLTFNFHSAKEIRLIFHHPAIVDIASDWLKGDYKDRRIMYFASSAEVEAGREELGRILNAYVALAKKNKA